MNFLTTKNTVKVLSAISLIFSVNISQNASATEHEKMCKEHIQNKIAWDTSDGAGAYKWEDANLENLCKGTKTPEEPGECFHKVMTGHIKWGDSDKWEWKNAIALCAGTDDADEKIACFEGRIKAGEKWDAAIFQCKSNNSGLNNKVPE
ncbi:hypothetical protein [Methylocucumis oryzae]|uniref:Uncharacterized protein n=1 Tax=Methylocucumis oryzae TaxID=1632867 RepID=A0A0F3ILS7_9GAMM|nr:hypothetical protein [Methylocucumis oryzae]KJV07676.1 hypothetical protein VZ94_03035 [Methylocucumis oryzae]